MEQVPILKVALSAEVRAALAEYARELGISQTDVVRLALREYLPQERPPEPQPEPQEVIHDS